MVKRPDASSFLREEYNINTSGLGVLEREKPYQKTTYISIRMIVWGLVWDVVLDFVCGDVCESIGYNFGLYLDDGAKVAH